MKYRHLIFFMVNNDKDLIAGNFPIAEIRIQQQHSALQRRLVAKMDEHCYIQSHKTIMQITQKIHLIKLD